MVYHFFPHYRAAVLRELAVSPHFDYRFFADDQDFVDQAIPGIAPGAGNPVVTRLPCHRLIGPVMWQSGLLRLALLGDFSAFILLGNAYWPATWLALMILRVRRKPAWLWTHGWVGQDSGPKRTLRSTFYKLATGLLLYGHFAKQNALTLGFPSRRLQVIRNSLDLDAMATADDQWNHLTAAEARATLFADATTRAVICATRLLPGRRLPALLEALARLCARGEPLHLILVGGGPEEPALRAQAEALGLSVHFEGPCYDETRLALLFKAASACVIPRNIGLLAINSLAHGCPVITLDDWSKQFPEFEAVVPGVTGYLTDIDSVDELARVLTEFTADANRGTDHADACKNLARRFYSPQFQRRSIEWVLMHDQADDLFFHKI